DEHFDRLIALIAEIEQPLETLERRGITLEYLAAGFLTEENMLPRFRIFLGSEIHWLANKAAVDEFLARAEAERGDEFQVAEDEDLAGAGDSKPDSNGDDVTNGDGVKETTLQMLELHEVRDINRVLRELRDFGFTAKDLVPAGNRNGEPFNPFTIENEDGSVPLSSLRQLLPKLRSMGEKGLRLTRFKGLGEMDPEELWETSMDPEKRTLLQVTVKDAAAADEIFRVLMGDHVEPRREFIEKYALDVKDLDV
ncbi:MAG: DNA gyrase subunit B, partial [Planctomycetes bacterium]|nr:DNA gyrase subunit B [Planctomycetota bacterium]